MKRLLVLFLSSALFFIACGEDEDEDETKTDAATADIAISCLMDMGGGLGMCFEVSGTDADGKSEIKKGCGGTYAESACDVKAGSTGCQDKKDSMKDDDGKVIKGT